MSSPLRSFLAAIRSKPDGGDSDPRDLRVLRRFDSTHADGAYALAVLHDRNAAFQQSLHVRSAQKRHPTAVDDLLVDPAFTAAQRSGVGLCRSDMGRDG